MLQLPTAEACFCAAQRGPGDGLLRVVSLGGAGSRHSHWTLPASALADGAGEPLGYEAARAVLAAGGWAAYPLGCAHVLAREAGVSFAQSGLRILLSSAVPEGKGVSSSAAVEVSTMAALASLAGAQLSGLQLATWCQLAENCCVGAPCGIMDQCASALGREGQLLQLLCRPAEVQGTLALGAHASVWGVDCGIRHSVGGSDYGTVRCAAFMGRRMVAALAAAAPLEGPARVCASSPARVPDGLAHLTALAPHEFERAFAPLLPDLVDGAAFARAYGAHGDAVTTLQSLTSYNVRAATAHAVHEHHRVCAFAVALQAPGCDEQLAVLGQLMYQSHESYSRCGLGSAGTDAIVALVEELGPARGLFGAKITGGGSGGTVCILGRADAGDAVAEVVARYTAASGREAHLFTGSSPGALEFGTLRLTVK